MSPGLVSRQPHIRERFWAETRPPAEPSPCRDIHNLGTDRGYHFIEMETSPGASSEGVDRPGRGVRGGPRVQAGPSSCAGPRGGAREGADPPRRQAGERSPDGRGRCQTRRLWARSSLERAGGGRRAHRRNTHLHGARALRGHSGRPELRPLCGRGHVLLPPLSAASIRFGPDPNLVRLHREEPLPDIRKLAPDASTALSRSSNVASPSNLRRYQSAEELAEDLQSAVYHLRDTESPFGKIDGLLLCAGGGTYRILFQLPGDRLQEVYLELTQGKHEERFFGFLGLRTRGVPP